MNPTEVAVDARTLPRYPAPIEERMLDGHPPVDWSVAFTRGLLLLVAAGPAAVLLAAFVLAVTGGRVLILFVR